MLVLIIIIVLVLLLFFLIKRKKLLLPNLYLVTGGVKTGKTLLSVYLAKKIYRKQLFQWRIKSFFARFVNKRIEKPLFYSNIPIRDEYVPLTLELLKREKRFRYKSVILIDEASLLADSYAFKDDLINEVLTLFNKLIGHETKGGYLIYDTQSLKDNHFATKRCLTRFLWIYSKNNVPFFAWLKVREMMYSSEGDSVNVVNDDVEKTMLNMFVPKKYYKMYDCYCYSVLTDNLPVVDNVVKLSKKDNLKTIDILQVREFKTLKKEKEVNDDEMV